MEAIGSALWRIGAKFDREKGYFASAQRNELGLREFSL